jgi:plasmid stabilization system protein ParE
MYRPGRIAGTREAVVHRNYILVYRVTAEAIEVVSRVHARRAYP